MLRILRCKRGEERGIPFGTPEISFSTFLNKNLEEKIEKLKKAELPSMVILSSNDKSEYVVFADVTITNNIIGGKPKINGTPIAKVYKYPFKEGNREINYEIFKYNPNNENANMALNILEL